MKHFSSDRRVEDYYLGGRRAHQEDVTSLAGTSDQQSEPGEQIQDQHPQGLSPQSSETRLIRYVDAFNFHREKALVRRAFANWHNQMWDQSDRMRELEAQAIAIDRRILTSTALGLMRVEHHQRIQEAKTDRVFEHLYRRAEYARDLYLIGRAFSQWFQLAAEKVEQTQVAKRHVLRVKYFQRWHYFTTTQEYRAQQIGLRLHMTMLRKKLAQIFDFEATALTRYHDNLTKMVFWRWYYTCLDARAPRLYLGHLKMKTLSCWISRLRNNSKRIRDIHYRYQERIARKAFNDWATKTRIDLGGDHQAEAFRRRRLIHHSMTNWRTEAMLTPLESQVNRMRDWRVARTNFHAWLLQARLFIKADQVNRLRVQQNAWTTWNEQLRINTVQAQSKQLIIAQSMYQWVLSERGVLLRRRCDLRMKRNVFRRFKDQAEARVKSLADQEVHIAVNRKRRLLDTTFECWKLQMSLRHEREQIAQEYYISQGLRRSLVLWRAQNAHLHTLDTMFKSAEYFFAISKFFPLWRAATKASQKKRRQEAYLRMRRIVKVNLARRSLSAWQSGLSRLQQVDGQLLVRQRELETSLCRAVVKCWRIKTQRITELDFDAVTHNSNYLQSRIVTDWRYRLRLKRFESQLLVRKQEISISLCRATMEHWRTRTRRITEMDSDAKTHDSNYLQSRVVTDWRDKLSHILSLNASATRIHASHIADLGSTTLRKLSYRAFEVRMREQQADAMNQRYWAKHRRGMLRLWAESTADAVSRRVVLNETKEDEIDQENDRIADEEESPSARRNRMLDDISNRDFEYATDSRPRAFPASEPPQRLQTRGWIAMPSPTPVIFDDPLDASPWVPPLSSAATPAYLMHTPRTRRIAARAKTLADLRTGSTTPKGTPPATSGKLPFAARLRGEGEALRGTGSVRFTEMERNEDEGRV